MSARDFVQRVITYERGQIFDFRQLFRRQIESLLPKAFKLERVRFVKNEFEDGNHSKRAPLGCCLAIKCPLNFADSTDSNFVQIREFGEQPFER